MGQEEAELELSVMRRRVFDARANPPGWATTVNKLDSIEYRQNNKDGNLYCFGEIGCWDVWF